MWLFPPPTCGSCSSSVFGVNELHEESSIIDNYQTNSKYTTGSKSQNQPSHHPFIHHIYVTLPELHCKGKSRGGKHTKSAVLSQSKASSYQYDNLNTQSNNVSSNNVSSITKYRKGTETTEAKQDIDNLDYIEVEDVGIVQLVDVVATEKDNDNTSLIQSEPFHTRNNASETDKNQLLRVFEQRNQALSIQRREAMARSRARFVPGSTRIYKSRDNIINTSTRSSAKRPSSNRRGRSTPTLTRGIHVARTSENRNPLNQRQQMSNQEQREENHDDDASYSSSKSSSRRLDRLYEAGKAKKRATLYQYLNDKSNTNNNDIDDEVMSNSSFTTSSSIKFNRLYDKGKFKNRIALMKDKNNNYEYKSDSDMYSTSSSSSSSNAFAQQCRRFDGLRPHQLQHQKGQQHPYSHSSSPTSFPTVPTSKTKRSITQTHTKSRRGHRNMLELQKRDLEFGIRRRNKIHQARAISSHVRTLPQLRSDKNRLARLK